MQNLLPVNDQLSSKELFESFKIQLTKDFQQSNFPTDFIQNLVSDYAGIQKQLVSELQRTESPTMQLLNRIDISEAQLKKYLRIKSDESRLSTLAELIIKRVLQKVVIKQFYKKTADS